MSFSNLPVSIESLPQLRDIEPIALSRRYMPTNLIATALFFGGLMMLLSAARFQPFITVPEWLSQAYPIIMTVLFGLAALQMLYHCLADPIKCYALREQDVSYTHGLIFRRTLCQPMLRIQHIEVKRGPIERMAGLASVHVYSAGGSLHTFKIPGLDWSMAQQVRQFIIEHKDVQRDG